MITSYKNVRMITKPHFDRLEAKQKRKDILWVIGMSSIVIAISATLIVLAITGVIV